MELTYDEIMDRLDKKHFPLDWFSYNLPVGTYEVRDINKTLAYLIPDFVKVKITSDDFNLKTNLKIYRTLIFTKIFFPCILGFTLSPLGPLNDIEGFIHLISDTYRSERPFNNTDNDKVHLKCDCIRGRIVNAVREPILYIFGFTSSPGYQIYKEQRINFFKKLNKSVLSHITFFLEDDGHKPVDFNNETETFTCQPIKI